MSEKVSQEDMGAVGYDAPGDNVYRMPRRSEWRRRTARRKSPLARVLRVREPVTPLRRPVPPRPSPRTPAPPKTETRQAPTQDAEFYIAVQAGVKPGMPWRIGRIPATSDLVLDKRAFDEALDRGWLYICERTCNDGSKPFLVPVRFSGALSSRDMTCEALKRSALIAEVIGYDDDSSKIANKIAAATVLTTNNVLEQD